MPIPYRPPWLDERIKASTSRDSARQAARRENRASGYVPPPPAKKAYVPTHLLAGGVPKSVLPEGTPAGIDLGIREMLPDLSPLARSYNAARRRMGTNNIPGTGAGLSTGINEAIRNQIRKRSVAQRQQASMAARNANLEAGLETREGTIPSGWGGLSDLYRKKPYSDNEPRLYDYSQQQEKFGSFEDYQKAVEARKHGYVPNRYDDIADYLETDQEEDDGSGGGGSGGGYPYYPGGPSYKTKEQYQPGHRPDWALWATFVQETTWNV